MTEDVFNSIADVPEIEAEKKQIEGLITDLVTFIKTKREELKGTEFTLFDTSSSKESTTAIKQGKKAIEEITATTKEHEKLLQRLIVVEAKLAVAQSEEAKTLAVKNAELNNANKLNRELALGSAAVLTATQKINAQVAEAAAKFKELAYSKKLDNAETQAALKRYQELQSQVVKVNQLMGNYRDNVGNYSSATNALGFSVRNISSELPNLGISLRTFAQSLSNNITPLVDNIKAINVENKALAASGKPTVSALKQLGSAFLSLNTLVSIGVIVGLKMVEYFSKQDKAAQEAEKAIKKYTDALNSAEESERSAAQQQIARLNILTSLAKDNTQTTRARILAVEELQKTYPSTFGALETQAILEGNLGNAVNKTTQALLDRAAAQAAEKKFSAASEKDYDLKIAEVAAAKELAQTQKQYSDAVIKQNAAIKYGNAANIKDAGILLSMTSSARDNAIDNLARVQALRIQAQSEATGFLKDAQESAAKAGDILFNDRKTNSEKIKPKRDKTAKSDTSFIGTDIVTQIFNELNDIEQEITLTRQKSLDDLRNKLEAGVITVSEYEKEKKVIITNSEAEIVRLQADSLEKTLDAIGLSEENKQKVIEKYTDLRIDQLNKETAAEEAELMERQKIRERFDEINKKNIDDKNKKEREDTRKQADYIKKIQQELTNFVFTLLQGQTDKKIEGLGIERRKQEENAQKEIEGVQALTLSEDKKAARIKEIQARELAQKTAYEDKVAALKERQAKLDKAIAIGAIVAATAKNVVEAYPNPITMALAAALGGLQIATVAARPIPKYAEGTTDHIGGKAILGDGGIRELVIEPNKKPYWSADTDTLYNLPKHTKVIPESKLNAYASGVPSNRDVVNAVYQMTGHLNSGFGHLGKIIKNKESVSLQGKNRRWENYYYENTRK